MVRSLSFAEQFKLEMDENQLPIFRIDLGDDDIETLVDRLFTNNHVIVHNINDESVMLRRLAQALQSQNVRVRKLELFFFGHEVRGPEQLRDALGINTSIEVLSFVGSNGGFIPLVLDGVTANTSIQRLSFLECGVTALHARNLAAALSNLQELDLSSCRNFGNEGATVLATALPECEQLKNLTLTDCRIGDVGASVLARELPANLFILTLSQNPIGCDGAIALAGALTTNKTLLTLQLQQCRIGDEGAVALGDMLKANNHLTILSLVRNDGISDRGRQALIGASSWNVSLTELSLDVGLFEIVYGEGPPQHILQLPPFQQEIDCNLAKNRFRKKYLTLDKTCIAPVLYPQIFAQVSNKPSALFLFLHENEKLLFEECLLT
jgi:hypothetical protein